MLLGSKCSGWWWIFLLLPTIKKVILFLFLDILCYTSFFRLQTPPLHISFTQPNHAILNSCPHELGHPNLHANPMMKTRSKENLHLNFPFYIIFSFLKCSHITDQHVTFHSLSYSPRVGSERNAPFPCFCKL